MFTLAVFLCYKADGCMTVLESEGGDAMIILASINNRAIWRGTAYRTTIGSKGVMGQLPYLAFLAPTWEMVLGHKSGRLSDEQYVAAYRKLLKERWEEVETWLLGLQPGEDITLLCYCPEGKFCHRQLIYKMLRYHRPDIEVVLK